MQKNIKAHEIPIGKLLGSQEFIFKIPHYQRPYSWGEDQALQLFDDLFNSWKDELESDEKKSYFLGSIVLIKKEDHPESEVVDGQQRLTTLTIMLSVLKSLWSASRDGDALSRCLTQPADQSLGILQKDRLTIREKDMPFFRDNILGAKINGVCEIYENENKLLNYSDSIQNIITNASIFCEELKNLAQPELNDFISFLLNKVYFVVVETYNFNSAYRIFSTLNNRGLDLNDQDILKAEILKEIAPNKEKQYSEIWENIEEELGVGEFGKLIAHIRTILCKERPHRDKIEHLKDLVFQEYSYSAEDFIDKVLLPYSEAYKYLANYDKAFISEKVKIRLKWLKKLSHSDWMPPAMMYLVYHKSDESKLLRFLVFLDRLATYLYVTSARTDKRMTRFANVVKSINNNDYDLFALDSILNITKKEREEIIEALSSANFYKRSNGLAKYVLLRIDESLSDSPSYTPYDYNKVHIEHILPQNPEANSQWIKDFSDEDRDRLTHSLGNLALLPHKINSRVKNNSFKDKKNGYFTDKNGTCPFAITSQIILEKEWSPSTVELRRDKLIEQFKKIFEIR